MAPVKCPFCNPPAEDIVARNDLCYARRDRFPVSRGHLLVMPFRHTPDFFPMTPEDQNRIAIDPDWFLIAIMIAIAFSKSGSGYEM